jgi:hypothetical protein
MKHFMIAAQFGHDDALIKIKEGYKKCKVTKENFAMALHNHQKATNAMKSNDRESGEAAYKLLGISTGVLDDEDKLVEWFKGSRKAYE